jgi:hypothetical protein
MWSLPTPYDRPAAMAGLGADESDTIVLRRVDTGVAELVKAQKVEETRRKITLVLTAVGVLFAGVKLGFIAVPHLKGWRK